MKLVSALYVVFSIYCVSAGELKSQTAIATSHFTHWLGRDKFFNDTTIDKVSFMSSALGFPDLPSWLNLLPSRSGIGAYLYGSPASVEDAAQLQIVATYSDQMKTVFHTMEIKVAPKAVPAEYFVELKIDNFDLEDMLHEDISRDLLGRVQEVWPRGGDVYVHKIRPLKTKSSEDKGVLVAIGGTRPFSNDLRRAVEEQRSAGCGTVYKPGEISIHRRFAPDFIVDWCALNLSETRSNEVKPSPVTSRPDVMGPDDVMWHKRPRRPYLTDFMVTVVFPCVLAAVIVLLLAYVMFGRREGLFKRDEKTPEEQLTQFNTIRRATANLRMFSDHRDSPHPLRIEPLSPRETYYMDTLPRQNLLSTNRPAPGTYSSATNQETP